jgi:hypothetical protein
MYGIFSKSNKEIEVDAVTKEEENLKVFYIF